MLPTATLLLAGAILATPSRVDASRLTPRRSLRPSSRILIAVVAVASIVVIAIPLASTSAIRRSEAAATSGNAAQALSESRSAANIEPFAATPRLQEALLFEQQGDLGAASREARAATRREATNWRVWATLSRIEAKRGNAAASVAAYRRARTLDPRSALFAQ